MFGKEMAKRLHKGFKGLSFPIDMELIAVEKGLIIKDWPFLPPVEEVKVGRWIGLKEGLSGRWRRWNIAHALGHHLMHKGNQLSFRQWQASIKWKQERQANEFAAYFLMPEEELKKLKGHEIWETAKYFGVPEEIVWFRLTL